MVKYWFIFLLLLPLTVVACSDDNDDDETASAPALQASTPADGSTNVPISTSEIVLTFDQNVKCMASAGFDGLPVTLLDIAVTGASITVDIPVALNYGETHTLTLPAGSVVSAANTSATAPEISITFTTEPAPEVDIATALVTESPMAETAELYAYLLEQYGKTILSASMSNVNWNFDEAEMIYDLTGKYPAIATMDYIHMYTPTSDNIYWTVDYTNLTEVKKWVEANGILAASWHWMVPTSQSSVGTSSVTYEPAKTTFRAKNALTDGTWENTQMLADLEKISSLLLLLQNNNIPLIWRPLHEAAGNTYEYSGGTAWFWWGYDGAETYKQLWQYMFNYFKDKGINNLIWVWTSCNAKDAAFYPGDEYVDIVGIDIYNKTNASDEATLFTSLSQLFPHKMITLSECGNVANIGDQWTAGARWSYFMPWYDWDNDNETKTLVGHEHADDVWWKAAMASDYVITRDELP